MAKELAAMAAGLAKQVQKAQMDFAAYSIIIFQALPMVVLQKSISLNIGKDFKIYKFMMQHTAYSN